MSNKLYILALTGLLTFAVYGCSSAEKEAAAPQALLKDKEAELSVQLERALVKKFGSWKDAAAEKMLAHVQKKLIEANPGLKSDVQPRIILLASEIPLSFPGLNSDIYLTKGAVQSAAYENELAFLLLPPIVLSSKKIPLNHYERIQQEDIGSSMITLPTTAGFMRKDPLNEGWFETGGFADYGPNDYNEADRSSVNALHAAKYDHRGGAALYKKWSEPKLAESIASVWKLVPNIMERSESVRDESAKLIPLKDSILKTKMFDEYKKKARFK